jgi:hypothetical protein
MMKKVAGFIALMTLAMSASAEGLDANRIYVGGGFGFNSLPGAGSARGFQMFAGYDLNFKINDDISTALELGYMDSGNFDYYYSSGKADGANGVWFSAVESVPLSNKVDMLVRLGYDFGDDDGLMLGSGLEYKFDTKVAFRMEYVARDHINGLQANLLVHF